MTYQAILLAAGNSSRSALPYNKVLHLIEDKPIIYLSASNFINDERCNKILLVCKEEEINTFKEVFVGIDKIEYVIGGKTRQESVNNALTHIDSDYVLIHDGARPYYSNNLLNEIVDKLNDHNAVIPAIKVIDTLKVVKDNKVVKTLNREEVVRVQTPQGFKTSLIKTAHNKAIKNTYTDDSSMVEEYNEEVFVVEGETTNIKFTIKEDF